MKRLAAAALLLLSACGSRTREQVVVDRILALEKDPEAFQDLVRAGGEILDFLKAFQPVAPGMGHPIVAVLYAQGEGDAVPLDLKAAHYATFRWPPAGAEENALVEPWVWDELERDLLLAGRHALPLLARALEKSAPDEATALRAARLMMRIGGRPAMQALAGLLDAGRDLGGVRVLDVAAAALLVMGCQDLPLRQPEPEAIARAAREWWAAAREGSEEDWIRASREALAARRKEKDPEGVEPVLELLEAGGEAAPPPALLARLQEGRGAAFDANRRLERATGLSAWMPSWRRVGDLRASLRLWRPPADLGTRWRRLTEGKLLRFTAAALGYRPKEGAGALLWSQETVLHPTESDTIEFQIARGAYSFHARVRDLGTRIELAEFGRAARVYEAPALRPLVHYAADLKAAFVLTVEEVDVRPAPRPPDAMKRDVRRTLKALAEVSDDGPRALAYLQDAADLPWFRERKAGAALLLLGDPAALELKPSLEPWEIEAALRVAKDGAVRAYLDGLRTAPPR